MGGWHDLARIVPLKGVKVRACKHVSMSMGVRVCVCALACECEPTKFGRVKEKGT